MEEPKGGGWRSNGHIIPRNLIERPPAELLAMIFQNVMMPHGNKLTLPVDQKHRENEIDTKQLLELCHVCRYWRAVALGNPALWTRMHGRHHDQLYAFLERSRPLAITLFLDTEHQRENRDGPLPEDMASVVEAHCARLRRLDLSMVPTRDNVVPLLASRQAPQLECLTMTVPTSYAPNTLPYSSLTWGPLLNGEVSSLRALAVKTVVDWMPSCAFPHLTHLFISFSAMERVLFHPFDLLRLLSNVPALTFLHVNLFICTGPYMGEWQPPSDHVALPHLRSLVFTSSSYNLMHTVVSHLSLPENLFIRLQDLDSTLAGDGTAAPLPPLPLHPVTSLDIIPHGPEIFIVADGPTSGLWLDAHLNGREGPDAEGDWEDWLLTLHERLTLAHVTHLHIYVEGWATFWPAFFAHVPQVTHLAVLLADSGDVQAHRNDSPTTMLCNALRPAERTGRVPLPLLSVLTIEWPQRIMPENYDSFMAIPEMLEDRARAGHRIGRVVLQPTPCAFRPGEDDDDDYGLGFNFIEMQVFVRSQFCAPGCRYDIVPPMVATGERLCAFEMRDVWKVDGEDQYWEVGDDDKPQYLLPDGVW